MARASTILCRTDEIAEGTARGFPLASREPRKVIVVRSAGYFNGWLDACPHYASGTPMAWRSDAYLNGDGTHIACHAHGALFDIASGRCVAGPCLGKSLTPVPLAVTDEGFITTQI